MVGISNVFFSFVMGIFDWSITKNKHNKKSSFGQSQNIYVVISSFGLITRVKLRAKDIIRGAIGNTYEEHVGNLIGVGNLMRVY